MIVRSASTRRRGMGVPYWDSPGAAQRGYLSLPGGFMPLQRVAADNNAAPPSEALLTVVNKLRNVGGPHVGDLPLRASMRAPARNYRGSGFRSSGAGSGGVVVRRGVHGFGLSDCLNAVVGPDGSCPDGSPYTGALDSGGAAGGALSFPFFTGTPAAPAPAAAPSAASSDWAKLAASVLPASFTTLQEAIAQPGQVVKTPTTLIAGSGANIASIPGLSTIGSSISPAVIIGVVVIGGLLIFGSKKH